MPSPRESRAALKLLTGKAVQTGLRLLAGTSGSPEARRLALLDATPEVIAYYSDGSAALAADLYDEQRLLAGVTQPFISELVLLDRTVKIRRGVAWAADPLFNGDDELSGKRLAEVIQLETARPYRDTILGNREADPQAVGWKRIAAGGCGFCRMLADRGAVYKEATAHFASHPNCHCTAAPVFMGGDVGPEANVIEYMASKRNRTPEQRERIRSYIETYYPD